MSERRVETVAAHGVRAPAPDPSAPPSAEPLYQTAVFDFPSIEASLAPLAGESGYVYSRFGLPNARTLELTCAALEGTEDAVATASGMAAIASLVLARVKSGEKVVLQNDAYGGTTALFAQDLARLGIAVELVDAYDPAAVRRALPAPLVIVETCSNPLVREVDVRALAAACGETGAILCVDNTFTTPILWRPIEEGAQVVLHSATKFLGGHHDVTCGVVCGAAALCKDVRGVARRFGMTAAPLDAWLTSRGIRTLAVRMERAQDNARVLATRLRAHDAVKRVHYPERGAVLSFDVGDGAAASRVVRGFQTITLTPSLGGTTTTASHAATSSHRSLTSEARIKLGIGDGLLRISVGIEHVEDIWTDLAEGLAALRGA